MGSRTQSEFVIYIVEFPSIFFEQMTGGASSNEATRVHRGGRPGRTENIYGPSIVEDITLTKSYDPVEDAPLLAWSKAWQNGVRRKLTVVKQPVNTAGLANGPAETYISCGRMSFTPPDVAKESAESAKLTLVLSPEGVQ